MAIPGRRRGLGLEDLASGEGPRVGVGGIQLLGIVQDVVVVSIHREPEERGIHLKKFHTEERGAKKVMDVLMDIESAYLGKNIGRSLVKEFFPGELRPREQDHVVN